MALQLKQPHRFANPARKALGAGLRSDRVKKEEQARQLAAIIEQARQYPDSSPAPVSVLVRSSSGARLLGTCSVCGYRFAGDVLILQHPVYGRRSISDRSLHYLGHGMARHETGQALFGEPVFAEIEVEEWACYLELEQG